MAHFWIPSDTPLTNGFFRVSGYKIKHTTFEQYFDDYVVNIKKRSVIPLNLETGKINLANGLPAYEITITQNESVPNAQKCNCKGYELITGSNDIVYHFVYRDYAHFDKYLVVVNAA